MTDSELKAAVDKAYRRKYPEITSLEVTHIVRDMLPGALVVVICVAPASREPSWEEMCYVRDGNVQIFDDTQSLVRAMVDESRNVESVHDLQTRQKTVQKRIGKLQQIKLGAVLLGSVCVLIGCVLPVYVPTFFGVVLGSYGIVMLVLAFFAHGNGRRLEGTVEEIDYRIDLQRYRVDLKEARAEKILRLNDFQLRRYYESTLRQNGWVFWLGILCIVLGVGISAFALWLVAWPFSGGRTGNEHLGEKIVTGILGAVGALLTNFVAAIYLKMHAEAAKNMVTLHARLVDTHRSLFGNLVASRIMDEKLRWETLSKIALNVSQSPTASQVAGLES